MTTITNIVKKTQENTNFRTVLYTGQKSQLVIMNIEVGGEIGQEKHDQVEQSIFVLQGEAKVILDGKDSKMIPGDVVVISPGIEHNLVNTGVEPLLIYSVYAPQNHLEGRIHKTKADAKKDEEDEKFEKKVNEDK